MLAAFVNSFYKIRTLRQLATKHTCIFVKRLKFILRYDKISVTAGKVLQTLQTFKNSIMDSKEDDKYTDESKRVLDEKINKLEQWLMSNEPTDEVAASAALSLRSVRTERDDFYPQKRSRKAFNADVDHSGHRKRMRRTAAMGLDSMSDIQLVELLLSYAVPRKDTNPIAHRLLDKFGSILGIMQAPSDKLVEVNGMTSATAVLLTMLGRLYIWDGVREVKLNNPSDAADFFGSLFAGGNADGTCCAYLDAKYRLIVVETFDGRPPMSAVIGSACKYGASALLIARRELAEFPDAFELTDYVDRLTKALDVIDVGLADFMIFTDYGYYTACVPKTDGEWQARYVFIPSRAYSRAPELLE